MPEVAQIPGYAEAVAKEESIRLAAFLDLPESIAGIEVRPYSPSHLVLMELARNPYLAGHETPIEIVKASDIAQFLWIVSISYSPTDRATRDKFTRSIRRRNFGVMHQAICEYLADAFQDSPPRSEKPQKPFTSWCALLVDLFASEYGWTDSQIISVPFKRMWQYYRARANRHDPKTGHINRSDKVRLDYLVKLNRKREAEVEKS